MIKTDSIVDISVDLIDDPEYLLRESVSEEKINELTSSIKSYGVIEPVIVEKANKRYRMIAGSLRLMACRRLSLPQIPCIIRKFAKKDKIMIALHENIMRNDMSPMELANALLRVKAEFEYTNEKLGAIAGKSQGWVSGLFGLLKAEPEIQAAVETHKIDVTSANTLMRLSTRPLRLRYLEFAVNSGATQSLIREWITKELLRQPTSVGLSPTPSTTELPVIPPLLTFECSCCKKEIDQNRRLDLQVCGECFDLLNEMMKAARKGG